MNPLQNGRRRLQRPVGLCADPRESDLDTVSGDRLARMHVQLPVGGTGYTNGHLEEIPDEPRPTVASAVDLEDLDRLGEDLLLASRMMSAAQRRDNFRESKPPPKPMPGDRSKQKMTSRSNSAIDVKDVWRRVKAGSQEGPVEVLPVRRTGWKTIRIFVSSTFTDFHHERDLLVKQIFPQLRAWCEERRLYLVEVDLRWGVPEELSKDNQEFILKTYLGEIDRCYDDNVMPYFLNMTSERIGVIPEEENMSSEFIEQYDIVVGLSVTEMEIVHAAYKNCNPNALFMLRDDSFVGEIEEFDHNATKALIDDSELATEKLKLLKDNIRERFHEDNRVRTYKCKYQRDHTDPKRPRLKIDEDFSATVLKFFKNRIEHQYPPIIANFSQLDEYLITKEQHEAFMSSRADGVFGRKNIFEKIMKYVVQTDDKDVPCVLYGEAGLGKSTVMAKSVKNTLDDIQNQRIRRLKGYDWHVFYHFVGAVPDSTDLYKMLLRLLTELNLIQGDSLPYDLDDAVQKTRVALTHGSDQMGPVIIYVDAINQFDTDEHKQSELVSWLPLKLPPSVRCILSMINDSPSHKTLKERDPKPYQIHLDNLKAEDRQGIIKQYLWKYRKMLSVKQMTDLLEKKSSYNPLWLTVACEELRIFGDFKILDTYLNNLADGLIELLDQVLQRFSREGNAQLLEASLCLLEVSHSGLLETELLEILRDIDYRPESIEAEMNPKEYKLKHLPYVRWSSVYWNLRPFVRPYGKVGEGRLNFYHGSLNEVVRRRYLKDDEARNRWHRSLADHFENCENYERKVEEYPHHLIALCDTERLQQFLVDWKAFALLFRHDHSGLLLKYWEKCGGFDVMKQSYKKELEKLSKIEVRRNVQRIALLDRYFEISVLFAQAGLYNDGLELATKCLEFAKDIKDCEELFEKTPRVYGHYGHILMLLLPTNRMGPSDIPKIQQAIEYHDKAIAILQKELTLDKGSKKYLALQLTKKAYALGAISDRSIPIFGNKNKTHREGLATIEKAIALYTEVQDHPNLLDAKLTEATLYRRDPAQQHKIYKETIKKCRDMLGRFNPYMARLCYNDAIVYEDEKKYNDAYDSCHEAYVVAKEVFGETHSKTKQYLSMLQEPKYKKFHNSKENDNATKI